MEWGVRCPTPDWEWVARGAWPSGALPHWGLGRRRDEAGRGRGEWVRSGDEFIYLGYQMGWAKIIYY